MLLQQSLYACALSVSCFMSDFLPHKLIEPRGFFYANSSLFVKKP